MSSNDRVVTLTSLPMPTPVFTIILSNQQNIIYTVYKYIQHVCNNCAFMPVFLFFFFSLSSLPISVCKFLFHFLWLDFISAMNEWNDTNTPHNIFLKYIQKETILFYIFSLVIKKFLFHCYNKALSFLIDFPFFILI